MSRFKFDNYKEFVRKCDSFEFFNNDNYAKYGEYKKPVNPGDYVYIFDIHNNYEAKTIYKVCYVSSFLKILVEVDPEKNKADSDKITGWDDSYRTFQEIERYKLKKGKFYWWVYAWKQIPKSLTLNNE